MKMKEELEDMISNKIEQLAAMLQKILQMQTDAIIKLTN